MAHTPHPRRCAADPPHRGEGGMSARILGSLAFLALTCATSVADAPPRTVLPGVLDLQLIDGSSFPADCRFAWYPSWLPEPEQLDCVAFPASDFAKFWPIYSEAPKHDTWRQASIDHGPVLFRSFQRPLHGQECNERVELLAMMMPPPDQNSALQPSIDQSNSSSNAMIWFARMRDPVCGDQRLRP